MKELLKHELALLKPVSTEDPYKLFSDFKVISEMNLKDGSAKVAIEEEKWIFRKSGLLTTVVHIDKEDLKVNLYKIPVRKFY